MGMALDKILLNETPSSAEIAKLKNPFEKWSKLNQAQGEFHPRLCLDSANWPPQSMLENKTKRDVSSNGLGFGKPLTGKALAGRLIESDKLEQQNVPQNATLNHLAYSERFIHLAIPSALVFLLFLAICGLILYIVDRRQRLSKNMGEGKYRKQFRPEKVKTLKAKNNHLRVTITLSGETEKYFKDANWPQEDSSTQGPVTHLNVTLKKVIFGLVENVNKLKARDCKEQDDMPVFKKDFSAEDEEILQVLAIGTMKLYRESLPAAVEKKTDRNFPKLVYI